MALKYFLLGLMLLVASIPIVAMNVISSEEHWSQEIKLYENAGLGDLEVFQNKLFVVGSDDRGELFYKVYNGITWSDMIQITFDDYPDVHPDAAVFNDHLYMTWHSKRDGQYAWDIYLMTFDGMDWTTPQRLTNNPGVDDHSSLTSYDGKLWLFWTSDMEGYFGIYYMIFNGSKWSSPYRLANGLHPSSVVFRDKLYVAWYSGAYVYIKFYDGYSWSEEIPVAEEWVMATTGLGVFNDMLYLLYASDRDGNWELYYKTFNGTCWSDNVRVTCNPAKDGWGHLVSYQDRAYLMWQRMTDSHTEVFYKTRTFAPSLDTWWDSNWIYRRQVNITERSGYSLTNFPVEITFRHNGHIQPDGRDIRVIDNNVEVPYAIIQVNSTHVTLCFEVNLTASTSKVISLYYGNPNATPPNYPLVPLTILEGNNGYAIINNLVYLGWRYTKWGGGYDSNAVVLWTDYKIDFDENGDPMDNNDLITDVSGRIGGIGRYRLDYGNGTVRSIGLGDYQCFVQTPVYVDIIFANASLRVFRKQTFVQTCQADKLCMFGQSWDFAKYCDGIEENIIDGLNTNEPGLFHVLYSSTKNPVWMAYKNSISGDILAGAGFNISKDYMYRLIAKEASDWDRGIRFDFTITQILEPHDQPAHCKIYWFGDNRNNYTGIEKMGQVFSKQPSIFIGTEEISSHLWLSFDTFKNGILITSNVTLFDENKTIIQKVNGVSTYSWLLPFGTYYIQASIFYNNFIYTSKQIQVNLTENTQLAINFLFGNLTVTCVDIENRPLENCKVIFTRQNEIREGYTNASGLATLEAYYGNWTVEAYWMDVLVGNVNINVNQSEVDFNIPCNVGDFTVIVVDQYGQTVPANVTLRNDMHNLTFSGYIEKSMGNITFAQIPLISYNLTIKDDFDTQTYLVNTQNTRQIRIETLPLSQKLMYIIVGAIVGVIISSSAVWIITKHQKKETVKGKSPSFGGIPNRQNGTHKQT